MQIRNYLEWFSSYIKKNQKIIKKHVSKNTAILSKIKTLSIFTGFVFYPASLFIANVGLMCIGSYFDKNITISGYLITLPVSLIPCGVICVLNIKNYIFHRKRCFGTLSEWLHEEHYSRARAKAMYPPIKRQLLHKDVTGICLGKVGIGPFKRYVCIDPHDKTVANHLVIIGNSGGGKSSGPILTSLIANFMKCDDETPPPVTYLVVDPKPELAYLSSCGNKWTRTLNPKALRGTSYGWDLFYDITPDSPLDMITDRIEGIVNVIISDGNEKNAFFQDSARSLLLGCLIFEFVINKKGFIVAIQDILSQDIDAYVKKIKDHPKCPKKVLMLLAEFGKEGDQSNATEDIKKSLKQKTAVFTRSDTAWFLDSDANRLMCSPETLDDGISLFLSIKRADLTTFGVLFRLIITQCSENLSRRDDYDPEKKPVVILIDEFTNLGGRIPHFAEDLGFIRSKKVTFLTIFQQYSQLQELYGKEQARTILSMGHQLVLTCEDTELGKLFSDKAGEFIDVKSSYKKTSGLISTTIGDKSFSESKEKRIRVMDDLTSLYPRYEGIAFINGSEYFRFNKCRYYEISQLSTRSAECKEFNDVLASAKQKNKKVRKKAYDKTGI